MGSLVTADKTSLRVNTWVRRSQREHLLCCKPSGLRCEGTSVTDDRGLEETTGMRLVLLQLVATDPGATLPF